MPNFAKLLSSLTKHMNDHGLSQDLQEKSSSMKKLYSKPKENYFKKKLLLDEVQSILLEERMENLKVTPPWDAFVDSKTIEMVRSMPADSCYHGLDDDIKTSLVKISGSSLHNLVLKLESCLKTKCESFFEVYQVAAGVHDKFWLAGSSNLPALIEKDLHDVRSLEMKLKVERARKEGLVQKLFESYLKSCRLLKSLLSEHRLVNILEINASTVKWLISYSDALYLKIRYLELQLLHETYSREDAKTLNMIRKELRHNLTDVQKETAKTTQVLNSYESVGGEFKSIVVEFAKVKEKIENITWVLKQFDKQ